MVLIKTGEIIKSYLRKPVQEKEVGDGVEDPDNDVKEAHDQRGEEEDLPGLHHPKDDRTIDEDVGDGPYDRPDPVS